MPHWLRVLCVCAAAAALASACVPSRAAAQAGPTNFVFEDAAPGAGLDVPTSIAFFPDGRMVVTEKAGRAWVIQNGIKSTKPLWESTDEILDNGDRGLLSVAIDPHYATNHFIYFSYVVDPDSDGVDDNDVAFGRITRFRTSAADSNVVDPASRTILLGTTWADGVIDGSDSHTLDALRWGRDGSLLVSAGEGALYTQTDPGGLTPNLFLPGRADPLDDIGSFRAQSVSSLGGKILRIDPSTGHGYPSNPYYDGDPTSKRSRVYAYGLRNPWRFTPRPGTGSTDPAAGQPGTLYIDNVGLNLWEALDVSRHGGENFAWPCYEGPAQNFAAYDVHPSRDDCGAMGTTDDPAQRTPPTLYYHHADSTLGSPPGYIGNGLTGGTFYTGDFYPPQYAGVYFFADYGQGWLRYAVMDSTDQLVSVNSFASGLAGPVDITVDPAHGDLYYVSIYTNTIQHIRWNGGTAGDRAPVAIASAVTTEGPAPLAVVFTGSSSTDPDLDPLGFNWNFGDGQGSTHADPLHVYSAPGVYQAVLTVNDGRGGIAHDSLTVVATVCDAFPTTNLLDTFDRADGPIGSPWLGGTAGFNVTANTLTMLGGGSWGLWGGATFGRNQEAYFTFASTPATSGQHNLYLKVQGDNIFNGCVSVRDDSAGASVSIWTFQLGPGWVLRGGPFPASFASGDRFGARAYQDGTVQVLKNGDVLGFASVGDWPFAADSGRVGLEMVSVGTHLDDFGGGDAVVSGNLPPVVTVVSPANGLFYAAGDTIRLVATATDDHDAQSALAFRWDVDIHHNNHVHPDVFTAATRTAFFIAQNHDDGTGVSYNIRVSATDKGALAGLSGVTIWPDVDLRPTTLTNTPDSITTTPVTYRFNIRNSGRMPAPISRWQLTLSNGATIAQGDTIVPALATLTITRTLGLALPAGTYTLRLTLDTLNTVHEGNEGNNARTKTLVVLPHNADAGGARPARFALSNLFPNPGLGKVSMALDLPLDARVDMSVYDLQGRALWRRPPQDCAAGRWTLEWPGRLANGERARPGLYLARVRVAGKTYTRRFALVE